MALTKAHKETLLAAILPEEATLRERLNRFMARSGFTEHEIADLCGYSRAAINHFRVGRYAKVSGNDKALMSAIATCLDKNPTPQTRAREGKLYQTQNYQVLHRAFHKALDNGFAYCIDGAPGTQKSYILESLCLDLEAAESSKNGHGRRAYYVYCQENIRPLPLLRDIAAEIGVPNRGMISEVMKKISFALAKRRAMLVLDEAQHLSTTCVETLRQLLDRPPYLGILFSGSHQLQHTFKRFEMEQWRSRLQNAIELPGIQPQEAAAIIESELGRSKRKAIEEMIADATITDDRKNSHTTYISARRLFKGISEVQAAKKSLAKGATA